MNVDHHHLSDNKQGCPVLEALIFGGTRPVCRGNGVRPRMTGRDVPDNGETSTITAHRL